MASSLSHSRRGVQRAMIGERGVGSALACHGAFRAHVHVLCLSVGSSCSLTVLGGPLLLAPPPPNIAACSILVSDREFLEAASGKA